MTKTLWLYWITRALFREGSTYATAALAANPVVRECAEGNVGLVLAAILHSREGRQEAACGLLDERVRWCRNHGDADGLIHALFNLHAVRSVMDDCTAAIEAGELALAEIKRAGEAGRVPEGRLRLFRGAVQGNLGRDWDARGDYERAVRLMREGMAEDPEPPPDWRAADLISLGRFLLRPWPGRDVKTAEAHAREGLALSADLGSRENVVAGLWVLALATQEQGQWARAVRLLAAAESLRQCYRFPPSPEHAEESEACRAAARAALGEAGFAAAWSEGRAMTVERSVEYALGFGPQDEAASPKASA